jgi:hypothetical protein
VELGIESLIETAYKRHGHSLPLAVSRPIAMGP